MEQNQSGIASWQWALTGVIVVVLIAVGIYFLVGNTPTTATSTTPDTSVPVNTTGANRLVVTDQFPGNIVFITTVQLAQPGFITIHKDLAGKAGDIIGSQDFEKGINTGKVNLKEKTVDGKTYHAILHYTSAKDGVLVEKTFKARLDLPEDKG